MAKKSRRQKLPTEKDLEKLSAPKAGESGATPDSRSDRSEAAGAHSDRSEAPKCHFERSEAESRNLGKKGTDPGEERSWTRLSSNLSPA